MFGHVLTFMVFYYVCHLRLSYFVYLFYSSVYVFVLFLWALLSDSNK